MLMCALICGGTKFFEYTNLLSKTNYVNIRRPSSTAIDIVLLLRVQFCCCRRRVVVVCLSTMEIFINVLIIYGAYLKFDAAACGSILPLARVGKSDSRQKLNPPSRE